MQAGFTKERRKEDNVFTLQYCVNSCKNKNGIIVLAIDSSKAYDLIKRELIKEIMEQKIHPDVIQSVADIYKEDSTVVDMGNEIKEDLDKARLYRVHKTYPETDSQTIMRRYYGCVCICGTQE